MNKFIEKRGNPLKEASMLRKKHLAAVLAFCLLVILVVDKILIDNRMNELRLMVDLVAQNATERLDSAKVLVELSAESKNVSDCVPEEAEEFLLHLVEREPGMWSHFLMTDLTGTEFVHTEGSKHYGKSIADREYFITPREQQRTVVAQPIHSVSTGRKIIAVGTPVFTDGNFSSVLVGFIHLRFVSELINQTPLTPNGYQMLVNADGIISAHPNEEYVLTKNVVDLVNPQTASDIMGFGYQTTIEVVDGVPSLLLYAPIPAYRLSVVTVLPLFEAFPNVILISLILLIVTFCICFALLLQDRLNISRKKASTMEIRAVTDSLTGLYNRQWLEQLNLDEFCKIGFSVIFFDVDNFKNFNDLHNHDYGDEVLKYIGKCLQSSTRPESDISIRYAGDEFLVLIREPDAGKAEIVANRIRKVLREYVNEDGEADPITICCGIATGMKDTHTMQKVITLADEAVYIAKKNGKDQIQIKHES